jgi:hypothetical protein
MMYENDNDDSGGKATTKAMLNFFKVFSSQFVGLELNRTGLVLHAWMFHNPSAATQIWRELWRVIHLRYSTMACVVRGAFSI